MLDSIPHHIGLPEEVLLKRASRSGWAIFDLSTSNECLIHCAADDEGLLEFVADALSFPVPDLQARPPNPGPAAKPAEHGAPPVAAPSVDEFEAVTALASIRHALAPFQRWARYLRDFSDAETPVYVWDDRAKQIVEISAGHVRMLLRAAGMLTDETQAPTAPAPGPAQAAEVGGSLASAAPAFEDDHVEMIDVGASDDAGEERLT